MSEQLELFQTEKYTETFDREVQKITQVRGLDYGHPLDDFNIAQRIRASVASCPNTPVRHALEMIAVKMARLCTTPHHVDSVVDIAGYARTIAMVLDEQNARKDD